MNLLQQIFESPCTEKLGMVLLHSLWQIALVALVVKLMLDWTSDRGKSRSSIRYTVAYLGLLVVCVLPLVTWMAMATPELVAEKQILMSEFDLPVEGEATDSFAGLSSLPAVESTSMAFANDQVAPVETVANERSALAAWVVLVWLLGMLVFALRPLIGLNSASRLIRARKDRAPEWVERSVERLKRHLGIQQHVVIAQTALVDVPTLVGIFRPTILLPFSCLTNLTADELDSILLHELAHIRRIDQLANLLQMVVETVFFFHPLVWWMSKVVRQERENCCDDLTVEACGNSKSLVSALLSLEERRENKISVGALASNGGSLVMRVKRLAEPTGKSCPSSHSGVSLLVVAMVVLVGLGSSVLLANANLPADDKASSELRVSELGKWNVNKSLNSRYARLEIESISDLYEWDTKHSDDSRMIHRIWNIATPELRNQIGRQVEGWEPDLVLRFTQAIDGTEPAEVTVELKLKDGFQWSIGNGVWDIASQWPLRYTLADVLGDSADESKSSKTKSVSAENATTEQLFNTNAYEYSKASLLQNHKSRWVAIVDGRILASFGTFEECVKAADEANRFADHRFVFRPGVDDVPMEFAYSPWITGNPNWWQVGNQFRIDHDITVATDRWISKGKTFLTNNGRATIGLALPDTEAAVIKRQAVASGLINQQLTITEADSANMRLQRFSVPGSVRSLTYKTDFQRVQVKVLIPELGIDTAVVAFVAPNHLVQKDPSKQAIAIALPNPVQQKPQERQEDKTPDQKIVSDALKLRIIEDEGRLELSGPPEDVKVARHLIERVVAELQKPVENHAGDGAARATKSPGKIFVEKTSDGQVLKGDLATLDQIEKSIGDLFALNETGTQETLKGDVSFAFDEATRRIILTGDPEDVATVRRLLQEIASKKQNQKADQEQQLDQEKKLARIRLLIEAIDIEIQELQVKGEGLKKKFGEGHPQVVMLNQQIDYLKKMSARNEERLDSADSKPLGALLEIEAAIFKQNLTLEILKEKLGPNHPSVVAAKKQLAELKTSLSEMVGDSEMVELSVNNYANLRIQRMIAELEIQLAQTKGRYGAEHPQVLSIKRQLEMWKKYHAKNQAEHEKTQAKSHEDSENDQANDTQQDSWKVTGRVTDDAGKPLTGVKVWANCGVGSLSNTGTTLTAQDGTYELVFHPGFRQFIPNDFTQAKCPIQAATIFASLDGYWEANLCSSGDRLMADQLVTEASKWGTVEETNKRLIVKGKPVSIHFVMKPAATVKGYLVNASGELLGVKSVSLNGSELPPSSSVLDQVSTDLRGRFIFKNVPTDKKWRFEFATEGSKNSASTESHQFVRGQERAWLLTVESDDTITSKFLSANETNAWAMRAEEKSTDGIQQSNRSY